MSGASVTIAFEDQPLQMRLAHFALMRPGRFSAMLADIGEEWAGDVQDNIRGQRLFDGSAMPPSKAAKARGGKTLLDFGHLRDSYVYQVDGTSLSVGSNMVYAAIHHFGGNTGRYGGCKIDPRPVLGMTIMRELQIGYKIDDLLGVKE